jgi:nascent polypeptide-associated complex subunit alpha
MIPNIDPRQLKKVMDRMGIKSESIEASRVVIETADKDIVIENPEVMAINAQGNTSFQISGEVKEVDKARVSIDEEDVKLVMEKSGVSDEASAREALEESNGNIAEAILKLKGDAA